MQIALSVKEVTKKFGDFTAVEKVSFDVEDGKFFSILGPSGCGKTTLLRMIAGFYEPSSGAIEIRGKNMIGLEPNKRPVNLIFQHLALFPMMDVKDNIAFGLRRRGEGRKDAYKKVESMLERVGLPGFENYKIDQLSGGQKQRVAIARCLVLEPSVLLLDEPLGALDLKLREHMKVELKELQAQVGTTFVYITHDQSEAMVMSDHVAVELDKGQKILAGKISNLEPGERIELFARPEAMIINPEPDLEDINVLDVEVKSILFDGGNSRLLVKSEQSAKELIVALPQNNLYDDVKPRDKIMIGWHPAGSVCFKDTGIKTYDEL